MAHFRQFRSASGQFSYLVADTDKREAVLIDPDDQQLALYLGVLDELQVALRWMLMTHYHAPSALPCPSLRSGAQARLVLGQRTGVTGADRYVQDGDVLGFGDELLRVMTTPGHTPGCVSYQWRDRVFTGDCLLIGDCGHTDEHGSDAGTLYDSLTRRLFTLPDETLVYPGHDCLGRRVSCIGEEKQNNQKLLGTTRDEFIAMHTNLSRTLGSEFLRPVASTASSTVRQ